MKRKKIDIYEPMLTHDPKADEIVLEMLRRFDAKAEAKPEGAPIPIYWPVLSDFPLK